MKEERKERKGGMSQFNEGHWEHKHENLDAGSAKYCGNDPARELADSVKKMKSYVNSHVPNR